MAEKKADSISSTKSAATIIILGMSMWTNQLLCFKFPGKIPSLGDYSICSANAQVPLAKAKAFMIYYYVVLWKVVTILERGVCP